MSTPSSSSGPPPTAAGASGNGSNGEPRRQRFELGRECELRIETGFGEKVILRLMEGVAEIFGAELSLQREYSFAVGTKIAVFTWYGAVLELIGDTEVAYIAEETPMVSYCNVHAVLEERRRDAKAANTRGPCVMIVGPVDSGKSTLTRILTNYAVRSGRHPLFVDLDIGQGGITIPSTLCATPVENVIGPEENDIGAPLAYFFGHVTPAENDKLFRMLTEQLASTLQRRLQVNADACASGLIINTCGWVEGAGYRLLLHQIDAFDVDVVLVLNERLHVDLQRDLQGKRKTVTCIQKSGGVVSRSRELRSQARRSRIREYFYGTNGELCPHSTVVDLAEVSLYRVGGGPVAPLSALPVGSEPLQDPTRVMSVPITQDLIHSVAAVVYARTPEEVLTANVAGFVHVTNVDVEHQKMTVLAPSPGPLPSQCFLVGNLKWIG